ncbi:hypothetical protein [Amycolatopsis thermoflava]|uniref:hypothetical protein n=1 Tax=Amycolatopsis thermoflava TaxID=84480 RepID=UPI0036594AC5
MAATGERTVRIKFDGSAKGLTTAAAKARAELRAVEKQADANRKRFDSIAAGATNFAAKLVKAAVATAALGGGVHVVLALAGAITTASGAAFLLPAAMGVAAAAMLTAKLGAEGAQRAFDQLSPTLDTLRSKVSSTFERELAPAVNNLDRLLPRLTGGFQNVASAMSDVAVRVTGALGQSRQVAGLNRILGGTATITRNIGKFLAPVVAGFINLAAAAMPSLEDMTGGLERLGQKFEAWTQKVADSGQVTRWIDNARALFRSMAETGSDVADIVRTVFRVFDEAGFNIGGVFGEGVEKLRDFLHTAEGHQTLTTLATTLKTVSDTVSGALSYALTTLGGEPLQKVLQGFQDLVTAIGPHLPAAIDLIATGMTIAGRAMSFVAKILDALPDGLADTAVQAAALFLILRKFGGLKIASVLASAFGGLPGILGKAEKDVAASGTRAGKGYGTRLRGALKGVGTLAVLDIVNELSRGTGGLFNEEAQKRLGLTPDSGLIDTSIAGWRSLGRSIKDAFNNEVGTDLLLNPVAQLGARTTEGKKHIIDFTNTVGGAFQQMAGDVTFWTGQTSQVVGSGWAGIGATTAAGAGVMATAARTKAQEMKDALAARMGEGVAAVAGGWAGIGATTAGGAAGMAASARGGAQATKDALAARMGESVGVVGSGWAGIVGASNNGANGMIGAANRGAGGVRGAFAGGGWFGIGSNIVAGIGAGVDSMAGALAAKAAAVARKAEMAAKAALGIHSPSRVFRDEVGKQIMAGWAQGLDRYAYLVERPMSRSMDYLTGASGPTFSGAPTAASPVAGGDGAAAAPISLTLDLGEGITQVFEIKTERENRQLRRSLGAGVGAAR